MRSWHQLWHPSSTWSAFLVNMPMMNLIASGYSCNSVSSADQQALPIVFGAFSHQGSGGRRPTCESQVPVGEK